MAAQPNFLSEMKRLRKFLTEDKWIKGSWVLDSEGMSASPENPDAKQFCLFGAFCACKISQPERIEILNDVYYYTKKKYGSIISFNDSPETTFEDITKFLKYLEKNCES